MTGIVGSARMKADRSAGPAFPPQGNQRGMKRIGVHGRGANGFTMVEIIAVLLIIGILSAVIVSRMASSSSSNARVYAEQIKSHLRYAQTRSMNSNAVWGIHFSTASTYSLFRNGNTNDRVTIQGESADTITLPAGMTVSTGIVSFDSWGTPYTDAAGASLQSGTRVIAVSHEGSTENIAITPNTGFVP